MVCGNDLVLAAGEAAHVMTHLVLLLLLELELLLLLLLMLWLCLREPATALRLRRPQQTLALVAKHGIQMRLE